MISHERLKQLAAQETMREQADMAKELLSLRKAREGWRMVPVEPDWEMLSADGCKEHHNGQTCLHHDNRKRIWSAMLAAAPEPD